ncbi:MAG: hypothetical protein ACYDHX_17555, partial [Methanothrix sp.]
IIVPKKITAFTAHISIAYDTPGFSYFGHDPCLRIMAVLFGHVSCIHIRDNETVSWIVSYF